MNTPHLAFYVSLGSGTLLVLRAFLSGKNGLVVWVVFFKLDSTPSPLPPKNPLGPQNSLVETKLAMCSFYRMLRYPLVTLTKTHQPSVS